MLATANQVWWIDSRVAVTLTSEESDGQLGTWLWEACRGAAAPLHVHDREDEQFLVVDGSLGFVVGDDRVIVNAGESVFLPRDVPHGYAVLSETARIVGSVTPAGFESFFSELGTPIVAGEPESPGPSIPELAAGAPRFGVTILGPPPAF